MSNDNELRAESVHFEMVPHWVMDHPDISPNAIRLYLCLRRFSDKQGKSFPSRATLAKVMQAKSLNTVDSAIRNLQEIGALLVEPRVTEGGDRSSNIYTLAWGGLSNNCTTLVQKLHDPCAKSGRGTNTHITTDLVNQDIKTSSFDNFWATYPRKAGKQAAKKAWDKAIRSVSADIIITGAWRYANDPSREDQYTKHPATWLNAGCWDDEPLPLRGTVKQQARIDLLQWAAQQDNQQGELGQ